MHADGDWQAMERILSKDMAKKGKYLQIRKLIKLNTTKSVLTIFHLNNKETKYELKVNFNDETLSFAPRPNTSK